MKKAIKWFFGTLFPTGMTHCPECKEPVTKVLYMGLPMKVCFAHEIPLLYGFFSRIFFMRIPVLDIDISVPCNGVFIEYEGPYFLGLMNWLFGHEDDDPTYRN